MIPFWLLALLGFTLLPAGVYAASLPNFESYIGGCGRLEKPTEPNNALLRVPSRAASAEQATLFVDPLCPTCKAFHQRLEAEGFLPKLDITLVLFPLDSECNWMLDRSVHPGACIVSKAILCNDQRPLEVLEWAYENQDDLLSAAKTSQNASKLRDMVTKRFQGIDACLDSKETNLRLNRMLRHIVNNHLPVSTPQMFLGDTRVCDEDTDLGLAYSLPRLAKGLSR